jgi:hypothetical protein
MKTIIAVIKAILGSKKEEVSQPSFILSNKCSYESGANIIVESGWQAC